MATIFKDLRSKDETLVVDAGGVSARSDRFMEQEISGILLRFMDSMGYAIINLTPADIALTGNNTLQQTVLLSSNYQSKNLDLTLPVRKSFDYTDAKGQKIRFTGVYEGNDSRFTSALDWLNTVICDPEQINVLLYYADRKPDIATLNLLKKFDAVIANLELPKDSLNAFAPLAKGKQMTVLSVQGKNQIVGRDILLDERVMDDREIAEIIWQERSALAKRQNDLNRAQYLQMTPEEFIKSYQKENQ